MDQSCYAVLDTKQPDSETPEVPQGYRLITEEDNQDLPRPEGTVVYNWATKTWDLELAGCREYAVYMGGDAFVAVPCGTQQPATEVTKPGSPLAEQVGGNHYKTLAIQPVEYCQKNRLGYIESNVVKYVTRHRAKNGRQDIEKAIHNLHILLEMEYPIP